MFGASSELASVMEFGFNWTTRGYANSRISNSRTRQLADVAGYSGSFKYMIMWT